MVVKFNLAFKKMIPFLLLFYFEGYGDGDEGDGGHSEVDTRRNGVSSWKAR